VWEALRRGDGDDPGDGRRPKPFAALTVSGASRRGPTRALFDGWSRVYDVPAVQRAVYRPVHDAVVHELGRPPARRILDVGCGTGILTARMAASLSAELVCGCDFSAGMLEQAIRRRPGPWLRGDAQRLPVRSGSVDAVVSTESFHWFPDPGAAMAEFARVLMPGGRLVIGMVNVRTVTLSRAVTAATELAGEPMHWPTRRELVSGLEQAGFQVLRQRRIVRVLGLALPTVLTVARR
jgi:ubiquinone/menaquinone biosynthesis C-methylase UbiE